MITRAGDAILAGRSGCDALGRSLQSPAGCSAQKDDRLPAVLPRRGSLFSGLTKRADGEYTSAMAEHAIRSFHPQDERPRIVCVCGWAYKHRDVLSPKNAENTLLDEYNIHRARCAARIAAANGAQG